MRAMLAIRRQNAAALRLAADDSRREFGVNSYDA